MRLRVVATYVTVSVVNATAGCLHLAAGESALGWAFILATLAFLLLGWEADGRLAQRSAAPEPEEPPAPALLEHPAVAFRAAPSRPSPRVMRRFAWLTALALIFGMQLRLLVGLDLLAAVALSAGIVGGGLLLIALFVPAPLQRRAP